MVDKDLDEGLDKGLDKVGDKGLEPQLLAQDRVNVGLGQSRSPGLD